MQRENPEAFVSTGQQLYHCQNLYVRFSATLANALKHKKRVIGWVVHRCQVSILLIGDKQSEYAYHQLGYRVGKNAEEMMQAPDFIEFF